MWRFTSRCRKQKRLLAHSNEQCIALMERSHLNKSGSRKLDEEPLQPKSSRRRPKGQQG
jgi:hypothetical protein